MQFDSRTVAFLAVAAFLCLLFLFCIVLSILFYIKYKNSESARDDKEDKEKQRIKKLKLKLAQQFKAELKKQTNKRNKQGKVGPLEPPDETETACSICLDSLAYGDAANTVLALLTNCGHVYHMDCVWPWLERDRSCPICRREMQLNSASLKAVTVYHVFNNFDVPSIRESVSRADLHSRIGIECMDVVSIESKTPRGTLIPVSPAPEGDQTIATGSVSGVASSSTPPTSGAPEEGREHPSVTVIAE